MHRHSHCSLVSAASFFCRNLRLAAAPTPAKPVIVLRISLHRIAEQHLNCARLSSWHGLGLDVWGMIVSSFSSLLSGYPCSDPSASFAPGLNAGVSPYSGPWSTWCSPCLPLRSDDSIFSSLLRLTPTAASCTHLAFTPGGFRQSQTPRVHVLLQPHLKGKSQKLFPFPHPVSGTSPSCP